MIANSVILNFIYRIILGLGEWYASSRAAVIIRAVFAKLRLLFDSSSIFNWIRRDGWLVRKWENSFLYRLAGAILNLPSLLHRYYEKAEPALKESFAFRLVLYVAQRLHVFVAAFLVAALAIPDKKWYNIYSTAAAAGLLLLYVIKQAADGVKFKGLKYINLYFMIFAVSIVLSEVSSIFPAESLRFLVFYLTCIAFMLLIILSVRSQEELYTTTGILLTGLGICAAYGIYQIITGVPVIPSQVDQTLNDNLPGRVFSTMGNANNFAQVLCSLIPFCIAMFMNSKHLISRLFFAAIALPAFATLLRTGSRSGWVGFAVVLLVYVFMINKKILPLLIIGGLLSIPILPDFVYRRLMTITNLSDSSISYRFKIWRIGGQVLKDYWVTGVGLGSDAFVNIAKNYYLGETGGLTPPHSHNLFLQMWLETGIVGIAAFVGFLVRLLKDSYRSIVSSTDKKLKNLLAAGLASIASTCAIGMFEYVWYYPRVMLFFFVSAGLTISALILMRKQPDEEKTAADEGKTAA